MDSETIDLKRLLGIIRQRFWVIILTAVVAVGVSGFYTFYIVDEQYEANSLLYVWQQDSEEGAVQYNDLMLYSQLVNDYQVLAKSRLVTEEVSDSLKLDPISAANLAQKIEVGTKNNTRHLTITVTDTNPEFAAAVANKTADVFSEVVVAKMGAANVQIIDQAVIPSSPSYPNKPLNLAIGLILGMMLGVMIIFVIEFFDVRVKTPEDVDTITGFVQLGVIPEFGEIDDDRNRR
ncbi:MAG: protein tyrosine kinase modulator [Clostridiales bacterium]|nr:protein tyrosine kinase modulator [Clostridiales bacterium]